jgi:hypothetical protein
MRCVDCDRPCGESVCRCKKCRTAIKREREERIDALPWYLTTNESAKTKRTRRSEGGIANQHKKTPAQRADKR